MGLKLRSNRIPSVTFSNLPATVDEGQSISPIVSIANVDNTIVDNANLSFNVYWEISGVGIASTDFENVGADGNPDSGTTLTGYVNLTGTTTSKQFPIGIRSDNFADLNVNETATFSLYSDAARTQLVDSDTFIINDTSMGEPEFDFLLVGGGGKGGQTPSSAFDQTCAGGGGAGGVLVVNNEPIGIGSTIYCEVAATQTTHQNGNNTNLRQDTSSGTILHYIKGGGEGATEASGFFNYAGISLDPFGGSGGGGAGWHDNTGGSSGSYGNNGGNGHINSGAGGGGGYATAGGNYVLSSSAGPGGVGYQLSNFFSELSGFVAGGGGGGGYNTVSSVNGQQTSFSAGTGGLGGGGAGGYAGGPGGDADDNTGSGGGGASPNWTYISFGNVSVSSSPGGDGASGVIYLKYIAPEPLFTYSGTQTVTEYIVSSGGGTKKYWVHKLTTSGQLTRTS
tara:strand:- start:1064 stop:2416 length:1353 start_codon:yes stop_codon:yes gene_type:complete